MCIRDRAEAQKIVDTARETGTPFCGGSTLKNLPVIEEIRSAIVPGCTVSIDYNADPESPFGGFYFYGAHAAELCLILCGENYSEVHARRAGQEIVTDVTYPDRQCVLITSPIKMCIRDSVYTVTSEEGDTLIPAISDVVMETDLEAGEIRIRPLEGLFSDEI